MCLALCYFVETEVKKCKQDNVSDEWSFFSSVRKMSAVWLNIVLFVFEMYGNALKTQYKKTLWHLQVCEFMWVYFSQGFFFMVVWSEHVVFFGHSCLYSCLYDRKCHSYFSFEFLE